VETNYFPLWECERGDYRLTHVVEKPKPMSAYTKLLRKFAHLDEKDLEALQEMVNKRYNRIKALAAMEKGKDDMPSAFADG